MRIAERAEAAESPLPNKPSNVGFLNYPGGGRSRPNVSKGAVTTTCDFAPGLLKDESIRRFIPYRLNLKNRTQLFRVMKRLKKKPTVGN